MILRLLLLSLVAIAPIQATVIGTSKPAESITAERIAQLPKKDRAAWSAYLQRSQKQRLADQAALAAERTPDAPEPPIAKESFAARSMPLDRTPDWYATPEARHTADVIVSFQTPAGGWSKNLDMSTTPRQRGQAYTTDNISKHLGPDDFDTPRDPHWNYVGTLDNDATTTQLRFLALISAATPGPEGDPYRASFLRGIRYLLAAQFPNGGWPQVWPLEGGYHDAITFNDGAVTETLELLEAVASRKGLFSFVPAETAARATGSIARGIDCILATQIIENGQRTVWGQQHDALTLQPVAGRNYEPRAECSSESASMLMFLMDLGDPSPKVVATVDAGAKWLEQAAIHGKAYSRTPEGSRLVDRTGGKALWARYYEIGTRRTIFGDRDKTIHDDVGEISLERQKGYSWYNEVPQAALDRYAQWRKTHP